MNRRAHAFLVNFSGLVNRAGKVKQLGKAGGLFCGYAFANKGNGALCHCYLLHGGLILAVILCGLVCGLILCRGCFGIGKNLLCCGLALVCGINAQLFEQLFNGLIAVF